MSRLFSLLLLTMFITSSCDEKKVIYVADHLTNCDGMAPQKCLKIKDKKEDDWVLFYDQIEGFDYKEGFTYKLEVNVSKVDNPPADGSNLKYKLVKIIYQEPSEQKTQIAQTLTGKWKVNQMIDIDTLAVQPTLSFKDGKVSGNAGCNTYGASYTIEENTISVGLAMATKMYCSNMNIEKAFFDCLQKAKSYKISDGKLVIYTENNKELMSCHSVND